MKWLGDGLMVAFGSASNALRFATVMQQASRRPVAGKRLAIRGLNAGETFRDEATTSAPPMVMARRLDQQSSCSPITSFERGRA